MPADYGVWLDNDKHVRPARPESGEDEPERAVDSAQAGAARGAPQVGQLLAQGEVLQGEVGAGAKGGTQHPKKAKEQREHRAMMHDGRPTWPGRLTIVDTVGKPAGRMASWRSTGTEYTVRLHFAELYWSYSGMRKFNVVINGTTVLSSFDIFATAGGAYKAVVRGFMATANSSGQIVINFQKVTDNATIEGIEILP